MSRRVRRERQADGFTNPYPASMAHYRYSHAIDHWRRAAAADHPAVAEAHQAAAEAWGNYAANWWKHENGRGPRPSNFGEVMEVHDAAFQLTKEQTAFDPDAACQAAAAMPRPRRTAC